MNKLFLFFPILWHSLFVGHCKYFTESGVDPNVLSQKDAEIRSEQISNIRYFLSLEIGTGKEFSGQTKIIFHLNKTDSPVRLDFHSGKIQKLTINGTETSPNYRSGHFFLSSNLLSPGENEVVVQYTHPYSRSGNGLHSFTDPQDGETYLYSQFETNHAHAMFPCFDQPDLKATYTLDLIHPGNWKVISATLPIKSEMVASDPRPESEKKQTVPKVHTYFPETVKFSTYIFSLHAGPYEEWKDTYNSIPLRLFSRKSLAKYVDAKHWFQITKQGFGFFNKYFEFPYPFGKYDQIIVPEFNFGAMENVAAVTFSERIISRGKITRRAKEKVASVILHEMAHMWFGNIVTMKWWDGLWLNESFATYLSAKAQKEATEYSEAWETFHTGMKSWAYRSDAFSTTHPIQAEIANTEEAFTNFDGITYGKGAAVLKQLVFFVGEEKFRKGIVNYIREHSYKNARLEDFLHSIESSSGVDLSGWSKDWLESRGTNEVKVEVVCSGDTSLEKIRVLQMADPHSKILREHKSRFAFFTIRQGSPQLTFISDLKFSGESTEFVLSEILKNRPVNIQRQVFQNLSESGIPCPDFVYPNYQDFAFLGVQLPEPLIRKYPFSVLNQFLRNLKEPDALFSLMLWNDLFSSVRRAEVSLGDFSKFAMETLPNDPRDIVLETNVSRLVSPYPLSYHSHLYFHLESERKKPLQDLEDFLWANMINSSPASDRKRMWFLSYIQVGASSEFFNKGINLLHEKERIPGLELDQDLRWTVLKKLCSFNHDDKLIQSILEKEKDKDPSRYGIDSALACEAAHPDPVTKGKWMAVLTQPTEEYSASTLRTIMYSLFPIHQRSLQIPFVEFYYQNIRDGKIGGDENYQEIYSEVLAPRFCTEENVYILRKFIQSHSKIPVNIKKNLMETLDLEEECLNVRKSKKNLPE
jgi:aminopeptidase N